MLNKEVDKADFAKNAHEMELTKGWCLLFQFYVIDI